MAYTIRIERVSDDGASIDPPLKLEEWKSVVEHTDTLQLNPSGISLTNPQTGEAIELAGMEWSASICLNDQWTPVFWWSNGRVTFNGSPSFSEPNDPVSKIAFHLASELNARVIGEEGEFYN